MKAFPTLYTDPPTKSGGIKGSGGLKQPLIKTTSDHWTLSYADSGVMPRKPKNKEGKQTSSDIHQRLHTAQETDFTKFVQQNH